MPETIYIGNDINTAKTKVLFDQRNFVELIDQYMGADAARCLECLLRADVKALDDAYEKGRLAGLEEDASSECLYYNNGHADGYDEGYDAGYAEGYAEGFEAGYKRHSSRL